MAELDEALQDLFKVDKAVSDFEVLVADLEFEVQAARVRGDDVSLMVSTLSVMRHELVALIARRGVAVNRIRALQAADDALQEGVATPNVRQSVHLRPAVG